MHPTKAYPPCHLLAENFHSLWKFDEVLTKIILHSFLRHGVESKTPYYHINIIVLIYLLNLLKPC